MPDERSTIEERCTCGAALRIHLDTESRFATNWHRAWLEDHKECGREAARSERT